MVEHAGEALCLFDRDDGATMDFGALYHFLFETFAGLGCLVGIGLVASIVACVIMERRTRKRFVDREPEEDDWSFFDDDEEDEEEAKK